MSGTSVRGVVRQTVVEQHRIVTLYQKLLLSKIIRSLLTTEIAMCAVYDGKHRQ